MSRKRLTKEQQLELDTERLNDAIDELIAQIGTVLPAFGTEVQRLLAQSQMRRDAIKLLPVLLERKAKLLGLDFVHPSESPGQTASGTLAELEQKLALVGRTGHGGAS